MLLIWCSMDIDEVNDDIFKKPELVEKITDKKSAYDRVIKDLCDIAKEKQPNILEHIDRPAIFMYHYNIAMGSAEHSIKKKLHYRYIQYRIETNEFWLIAQSLTDWYSKDIPINEELMSEVYVEAMKSGDCRSAKFIADYINLDEEKIKDAELKFIRKKMKNYVPHEFGKKIIDMYNTIDKYGFDNWLGRKVAIATVEYILYKNHTLARKFDSMLPTSTKRFATKLAKNAELTNKDIPALPKLPQSYEKKKGFFGRN
jgi:hypothetical protein